MSGGKWKTSVTTKCVRHSYPKRRLSRRILSIPHPRNQIFVAMEVEEHWQELKLLCDRSRVSLTSPKLSSTRALQGVHERQAEGIERTKRSVGRRFVLHADLARFYPSIYTHSIPWAIHGKDQRHNQSAGLFGNLLDLWVRETQSKQTGGIPTGPDTSYLIAEVIASKVDTLLEERIGELRGTRYIDDYHLYFHSRSDSEEALAHLHQVAAHFELDINDLKTSLEELPESIEPTWKTRLRSVFIEKRDHATSLKALFDLGAELAKEFEQDGVFSYLVKKVEAVLPSLDLTGDDWELLDALLLRVAIGDASCLSTVLRIFEQNDREPYDADLALNSICLHHSALQHSSEVAWALWAANKLGVTLSQEVANAIETMDDDVVALAALNAHATGCLAKPVHDFSFWRTLMVKSSLYSEHWLLAYEANVQGWLLPSDGIDYVADDPYFLILKNGNVKFFDTSEEVEVPEDTGYEDSSDYFADDEEEEEEEENAPATRLAISEPNT